MTSGEIDDAAAAKEPTNTARDFPGFEQLLTRETSGMADGTADAIEKCFVRETPEISLGEAVTGRPGEAHAGTIVRPSRPRM